MSRAIRLDEIRLAELETRQPAAHVQAGGGKAKTHGLHLPVMICHLAEWPNGCAMAYDLVDFVRITDRRSANGNDDGSCC